MLWLIFNLLAYNCRILHLDLEMNTKKREREREKREWARLELAYDQQALKPCTYRKNKDSLDKD